MAISRKEKSYQMSQSPAIPRTSNSNGGGRVAGDLFGDAYLGLRPSDRSYEVFTAQASEIVIGLVGPLGTDNDKIARLISSRLERYHYQTEHIKISRVIIPALAGPEEIPDRPKYDRAKKLIDLGDQIRKESKNNAVLAIAVAAEISRRRPNPEGAVQKTAYVISSLKHPAEVAELRKIYRDGFYLFAVHTDGDRRVQYLSEEGEGMPKERAVELVGIDEDEVEEYGQHTRDTFHLADFFLADENNEQQLRYSVWRCLDLIFGNPFLTPTFNEFAMFMAFSASLRSADLSRQVGAVVAKGNEILCTGANDCPASGGGLYWPSLMGDKVDDFDGGRDYKRGVDGNSEEKAKLIEAIASEFPTEHQKMALAILQNSPINNITEYGRVVHAEMDALLACARSSLSCVGGTIFCTTFPCHNCAKHIIAAGIIEIIFVEPYPKSKALDFHPEAATMKRKGIEDKRVYFRPFVGVGPRQFFDLFSLSLSSGRQVKRKGRDGKVFAWSEADASPRLQMLPVGHRDFENQAAEYLKKLSPIGEHSERGK